eukprot:GEMP01002581.1.p1 GENE.GEMP01002581.1~~GEMP01002581.1.p1  ORF type:complete len:1013 (+),score=207.23 GEMP01002581.1:205-3243(+)
MDYPILITRVFRVTLDTTPVKDCEFLSLLRGELEKEGTSVTITHELLERVLCAKLSIDTDPIVQITYLVQCSARLDECGRNSKLTEDAKSSIPAIGQLIISYMLLVLTCPELFGAMVSEPAASEVVKITVCDRVGPERFPVGLLLRLAERAKEEGEDVVAQLFGPMLTALMAKLQGRGLTDQKTVDLSYLTNICVSKGPLVPLIASLPGFQGPVVPQQMAGTQQKMGRGFLLQTESFLGYVLAPTSLDNALWKEKGARQIHFNGNNLRKRAPIGASIGQLRQVIQQVIDSMLSISNALLRVKDVQPILLEWFSEVLRGTEPRTKGVNQIHEGGEVDHFLESMTNSPMPFHQNLDMRLQIQLMNARMQGFPLSGFSLNFAWTLLELCKPIKLSMAHTLDAYFIMHPSGEKMLKGFQEETKLGDGDELAAGKEYAKAHDTIAPKFTTQLFWLMLKSMHTIVIPASKEHVCYVIGANVFRVKDNAKFEQCFGEHLCHEVIFESPAWYDGMVHFTHLTICFLLNCAYPEHGKNLATAPTAAVAFADVVVPPEKMEPQWPILPGCLLDNIVEIFEYYSKNQDANDVCEFFKRLDAELVLIFITFLLGAGDHVKNPSLRGKVTKIFMVLMRNGRYRAMADSSKTLIKNIVPSCIRVFSAVEKTKRSYYDIRMQLKYQLRAPIMELFEKMIVVDHHRQVLRDFAQNCSDEFLKFLNQMMSDATMQLDEGLDTLAEIRRRQKKGEKTEDQDDNMGQTGTAGMGVDRDMDDEDMTEGGEDMYRRSRADPKEHCRTYMKLGHRTIRTLWAMTKEAPQVIVSKNIVLQQMLHNCLNSCLDRLVGPKCLELKGDRGGDFELFNFNPRELLCWIAELYVFLKREDKDKVVRMIIEDGRSYKNATFMKATRILAREGLIQHEMLQEFKDFVQETDQYATQQSEAMANVDIPDEFLDPIMQEIMADPVLLPTSNTIMDRTVIERHIMSNDDDPFTRKPLKIPDLIPETVLRDRIHAFCRENNITIGS